MANGYQAALALVEAQRYNLIDADPSHLSAAQVSTQIERIQAALETQWLQGAQMVNLVEEFADFSPTVTRADLGQLRHAPDEETVKLLGPAHAQTLERLKAAGLVEPDSPRRRRRNPRAAELKTSGAVRVRRAARARAEACRTTVSQFLPRLRLRYRDAPVIIDADFGQEYQANTNKSCQGTGKPMKILCTLTALAAAAPSRLPPSVPPPRSM